MAVAKKKKTTPKGEKKTLKFPVTFATVSTSKGKVSVGIKVDREKLDIMDAERLICKARLNVTIKQGDPDQNMLPGHADGKITSIADAHGIRFDKQDIAFTLSFNRDDVGDAEDALHDLAYQSGSLQLKRVGDAGVDPNDKSQTGGEPADGEPLLSLAT